MKPLNRVLIGYWHSQSPGDAELPHPQSLVDYTWEPERRAQIVQYLKAGNVISLYCGHSYCRFDCRRKTRQGTKDPHRGVRTPDLDEASRLCSSPGCRDEIDSDYLNGTTDLSDGVWLWPEGLAHYVEQHGIRLPDEFVAHAAARSFRPPDPGPSLPRDRCWLVAQREFWAEWCRKHATFEYEPNCYACRASRSGP